MKSLDSIMYAVVSWVPGSTTNDYTPTPEAPPGVADYLHTILNWVVWLGGTAGIVGFVALGIRLALSDNRESDMMHAKTFIRICGGLILVAGAAQISKQFVS